MNARERKADEAVAEMLRKPDAAMAMALELLDLLDQMRTTDPLVEPVVDAFFDGLEGK